ncbi:D-alanyl-D-alanine carboxypeptidase family protein [Pedococcus sp. 2YAF34]|uniref:D-alanyl-D-alanine carboxypeptidase family protein n=1 Tax=Pedococcus sp. 2YAF34 TaxID=3233032 RepID=UPI003F9861CE
MPRRRTPAAAASLVLAVGGVVVLGPGAQAAGPPSAVAAPAAVAPAAVAPAAVAPVRVTAAKPKPTTTPLPVPRDTVRPELSVGGPRLASTGLVADLPPGVPRPPALRDVSWLLADLDTGQVIAAKAPHARLRPASTLKTLTALTLIPKVSPDRVVVATNTDADADGTRVGLVPGLGYTGRQLFQALLMSSGNDAAYALAAAAGGRMATIAAMNAMADQLGAHDTVAVDPSGLDAKGQTSSAYDLALIGRAALKLQDFRTYVTTKQAPFPGRRDPRTHKRASYVINNHNKLLYNYEGTIGVKNGYTEAAHRTYISAVTRGGRTYLLTEMYGLDSSWRPQAAMYDWAFRYAAKARPVGTLVAPGTVTTPPAPAPSPAAVAGAAGSTPEPDESRATAAAAALPGIGLAPREQAPWLGVGVLAAITALLGVLGSRAAARRRAARH